MPVPKFMAKVNRRIFNPMELRKGERPVLIHEGRSSGSRFETPLDAHPVDGGYVFFAMYGPDADWVRNILHAGRAELRIHGEATSLTAPRLLSRQEVAPLLPDGVDLPPGFLKVNHFLRMDAS
ncbi:MAG: nitroreductase family deazaflavin-dependent oxidoreductase [Acidimicrobiia bacterium]|nr:nitroreductase family deazaflavin-dependent oxidoreductase [Acidimicrobiia bacterium]